MKLTFFNYFQELTLAEWILWSLFLLVFLVRLYHLLFFTGRLLIRKRKEVISNEQAMEPMSVLLTVRNEEDNLKRLLPQLLEINTVKYEAIAVDDYSLDNTYSVLGSFRQKYSHFRISSLNEETRFSSKLSQNIALKAAQNDWVVMLPIEAQVVTRDWLGGFAVNTTTQNRNLLIGYTGIATAPGWFNLLCRIENFEQQIRSAGFISNGIPFVYFEENLAFRKGEYFKIGGYGQLTKEAYANLELIVNQFIRKKNTVLLLNQNSALKREVQTERGDYYNLLHRSYRIEGYLPLWKQAALGFENLTKMLLLPFFALMFVLFFDLWPIILTTAGILLLGKIMMIKILQNRLNEPKIFIPSLMYGMLIPYFKLFNRWYFKQTSRHNKWKVKV